MSDVTKALLSLYYGYGGVPKSERGFSSSEALKEISEFSENEDGISSEFRPYDILLRSEKNEQFEAADVQDSLYQINRDQLNTRFLKSPHILKSKDPTEERENFDTYKTILEEHFISDTSSANNDHSSVPSNVTEIKNTLFDAVLKMPTSCHESQNQEDKTKSDSVITNNKQGSGVSKELATSLKKAWHKKVKKEVVKYNSSASACANCNGVFLDLNNIGLSEFPVDTLHQISGIRMLYLDSNYLTEIPAEVFEVLQCLQWFDVRNNELTTLPSSIKGHPSLETLLIQENKFERLPLEIGLVPNLKTLQTGYNPLIYPPKDILSLECLQILNFLRNEWNEQNPSEAVELKRLDDDFMGKNLSTSSSHQSNTIRKSSSKFTSNKPTLPKISVRKRSWNYKPSNRCENSGFSIALDEQHKAILDRTKKMMIKQEQELQKIADVDNIYKWRLDRSSFDKSMKKAADRSSADIPYAVDIHDYPFLKTHTSTQKSRNSRIQRELNNRRNINEKMNELVESMSQLRMARSEGTLAAKNEQKYFQEEIKKITKLQSKLRNLRSLNDITIAPSQLPEVQPKKYVPSPAIII